MDKIPPPSYQNSQNTPNPQNNYGGPQPSSYGGPQPSSYGGPQPDNYGGQQPYYPDKGADYLNNGERGYQQQYQQYPPQGAYPAYPPGHQNMGGQYGQQPQVVYVQQQPNQSSGPGVGTGICAGLALCCCLDMMF
ncbi:hypothetical protein AYI70_g5904 [Smittium culicis]|uniref:Cysteine-rich transmembrane domain-containing protein n=1 Tax=Smittium culicis TaxID=133412 RepID=A0A1R1XML4_9FUNG|nr:hypothetical protein AYI70_g6972 [Smittium culicis]OMJ17553.1 hypothetical protein AYI70_g5904 [Smittium culicis]